MKAIGMKVSALLAATALAACGGGGGGSSSGGTTPPASGLPPPSVIVGANPAYTGKLESYLATLRDPLFDPQNVTNLPTSGTATFTGIGRITDATVTTADVSAASLRNRSVVTDASATFDFAAGTMTATQTNFIDVDGAPVAGQVNWTAGTTPGGSGALTATVSGDVGGTVFATPAGQASVVYLSNSGGSGVSGLFVNGAVSSTGWLQGTRITGDFAAR